MHRKNYVAGDRREAVGGMIRAASRCCKQALNKCKSYEFVRPLIHPGDCVPGVGVGIEFASQSYTEKKLSPRSPDIGSLESVGNRFGLQSLCAAVDSLNSKENGFRQTLPVSVLAGSTWAPRPVFGEAFLRDATEPGSPPRLQIQLVSRIQE